MNVSDNQAETLQDVDASDEHLLRRFVASADEQAFAELVARHGPLVIAVCLRVLRHRHDAEDAFQATFMVLASSARKIRKQKSLPCWLYGVAYRTAVRAAKHRKRREEIMHDNAIIGNDRRKPVARPGVDEYDDARLSTGRSRAATPLEALAARHMQEALDGQLDELPEKYRDPLVLHYLMGKTARQVADELGLSPAAVEGRLRRGRNELRLRLAMRGITLTAALALLDLTRSTALASPSLVCRTVEVSLAFAKGQSIGGGFSSSTSQLVRQELYTMSPSLIAVPATLATMVVVAVVAVSLPGHGRLPTVYAESPPTLNASQHNAGPSARPAAVVEAQLAMADDKNDPFGGESAPGVAFGGRGRASLPPSESRRPVVSEGPQPVVDYKPQSKAAERIRSALEKETVFHFVDTPISEVVAFLQEQHSEINIQLDVRALEAEGIGADTLITRQVSGISLDSGLRLMLRELDLDYIIQHEVLLVTSVSVARSTMEMRIYDIRQLDGFEAEKLIEVIRQTIRPETWRESDVVPTASTERDNPFAAASSKDGNSPAKVALGARPPARPAVHDRHQRAASVAEALPGCLVITQTWRAHEEILNLLELLSEHNAAQ